MPRAADPGDPNIRINNDVHSIDDCTCAIKLPTLAAIRANQAWCRTQSSRKDARICRTICESGQGVVRALHQRVLVFNVIKNIARSAGYRIQAQLWSKALKALRWTPGGHFAAQYSATRCNRPRQIATYPSAGCAALPIAACAWAILQGLRNLKVFVAIGRI